MDKIIVGILPQGRFEDDGDPYTDRYEFLSLYTKKIIEENALPLGLIAENGYIDEKLLDMCDCFLIQGGKKVEKYHYQAIKYAIEKNKPLMGICMGMHAIGIYSMVNEYLNKEYTIEDFIKRYQDLKSVNDGTLLETIPTPNIHKHTKIGYEDSDKARHNLKITDKTSLLYDIFKKEELSVVSLHGFYLKWIGKNFKASSISEDGIIESLEYTKNNRFILGILWHPEWDNDNLLFRRLIHEGEKRKMNSKYMILVNQKNPMMNEENYTKVKCDSKYADNRTLEEETYKQFLLLKKYVEENGYIIDIESGYRSKEYQQTVWDEIVKEKGLEHTKKYVAVPGYSEHQSGLAVDFVYYENDVWYEDHKIPNKELLKFIADNCYKFGFIIRYPRGKEEITGYGYEPWHLRYIKDTKIAKYIKDNDLCLEEYLGE